MIKIVSQLRNAAKFGSPVAPGEREKAADTIEKLVEALSKLVDIEGPLPGNAAWGAEVTALLAELGEAS